MTTNDRLSDELVTLMASRDSKESANVLAREVQSSRATLAAIEALHQPRDDGPWPGKECACCLDAWPCLTTRLLHPNPEEDPT